MGFLGNVPEIRQGVHPEIIQLFGSLNLSL
jgi:hypothetical protein